ncbi:MAG: pantoate--beta-alanine ligase [Lysobacterales bacterium]
MKIFKSVAQWQCQRDALRDKPLGFVPTMGALHPGHLSLVKASRKGDALTVVSVFVNPTQFDDKTDFDKYPADSRSDLEQLESAGVDIVLLPDARQIYTDNYRFKVTESDFSRRLCGAHRPGHFDGVLTVVMRLLNLVKPDNAYFGEKDYQQLQLIRDMVSAFFMPVNIVGCDTVREADGLAMSSRNQHLNAGNRALAPALYATLKNSRTADEARRTLAGKGFKVDYVEDIKHRRLAAVHLGSTRLIDNVEI